MKPPIRACDVGSSQADFQWATTQLAQVQAVDHVAGADRSTARHSKTTLGFRGRDDSARCMGSLARDGIYFEYDLRVVDNLI